MSTRRRRRAPLLVAPVAALIGALASLPAAAASLDACSRSPELTAAQQDRLLRATAILRAELDRSGATAALVARSGLNLRWFGMRYSHGGLSLRAGADSPWSVRQLYFACDERRPRLFEQGLAAFLFGTEDPDLGFVSVLLLPPEASAQIEPLALDDRRVSALQSGDYAANAHPSSLRFQNCNQWLVELLGLAWRGEAAAEPSPRAAAQQWLREQRYEAATFSVGWRPFTWFTGLSRYLTREDHPDEDLDWRRFRVSMPESIEAFVRAQYPAARRIELCHTRTQIVLRRGFEALPADCTPAPGDTVVALD